MSTPHRRGSQPPADLAALTAPPRLAKAQPVDPVLGQQPPAADPAPTGPVATPRGDGAPPRPKISFYMDPDDAARCRGAYEHTRPAADGSRTFSDFIARAVLEHTERLENKHNGGQPYPPLAAGVLPRGKPLGG